MKKETMEAIIKQVNELHDNLLFHPKDFDEKTFKTLVLTFIREIMNYLKDKEYPEYQYYG